MELKDTIDSMLSDNWKDRLLAEYHQLNIRTIQLTKAFDEGKLDSLSSLNKDLLKLQLDTMREYRAILIARLSRAGVLVLDPENERD